MIRAILYFLSIFISVDFYARRNKLKTLSKEEVPNLISVLKESGILILPLLLLIYLFAFLKWYPTRVAFWTILLTVILGFIKKGNIKDIRWIVNGTREAARNGLTPVAACACAGLIILAIQTTGIGLAVGQFLTLLSHNNLYILLFLSMILSIVLGMGLPTVAAYMIAAIVVAPSIAQLGVAPVAAHLFVFYFAIMSTMTPPVALSAYTGAGIAGGDPAKTGFVAFAIAFPSFLLAYRFIAQPVLLLQSGNLVYLLYQIAIVLMGFIAITAALRTQFFGWAITERVIQIILFISGIALVLPNYLISPLMPLDFVGILLFIIALIFLVIRNKARKDKT
jgi:TRAP transporter 4TM/12TM fusion protein